MDEEALKGVDTVIHLAGSGLADQKWTEERKKNIVDSRVKSADLIRETCQRLDIRLNHFISASAIGWYPLEISEESYDEEAPAGEGFVANVCKQWEASADRLEDVAEHVTKVRIGLVLDRTSGVLAQVSVPVKYYFGAGLGTGKQAMPWIHVQDACNAFKHIMDNKLTGIYNAVGPENATNMDFMQTLADVTEKPLFLPNIPEFVIRTMFGPKADLILKGVPISSRKIQETGFMFEFPTLNTALSDLYLD